MSSEVRKTAALVSLTATYSDSDSDSVEDEQQWNANCEPMKDNERSADAPTEQLDDESRKQSSLFNSQTNSPTNYPSIESLSKRRVGRQHKSSDTFDDEFVDYSDCNDYNDNSDHNNSDERHYGENHTNDCTSPTCPTSPISYHRSLFGKREDELTIPDEPIDRCSRALQDKIRKLHEKMKLGQNMNTIIQKRKDFRNPSIYEKLIAFCGIDELATNYPPDIYDPHKYGPESYYDELSKRQKEEMDRREREKKEKTKVEFISGTKKGHNDLTSDGQSRKKSKWDIPLSNTNVSANTASSQVSVIRPHIVLPVTAATGTKPTVISAFGTIAKKSK